MKADHLSTTLGVEKDVESHCKSNIFKIVPANFADVIMPRPHAQNGGFALDNCLSKGFQKFLRRMVSLDGMY